MLVWLCLQVPHRVGELRNGRAIGEGVAVAGVVDQDAGQEHGPQVVPVQDVHRQRGGGRPSVGVIRSAVLRNVNSVINFPFDQIESYRSQGQTQKHPHALRERQILSFWSI